MDEWRPQAPIDDETPWSRFVSWLKFVGPAKVVVSVGGVVVAAVIGWALLRPAEPGAEATLGTLAPNSSSEIEPDPGTNAGDEVASKVVVHVAGSVVAPGVYELASGARVVDAVSAAGGALARAATDAVNLASRLEDGQRVYLPAIGEVVAEAVGSDADTDNGVIDLNSATAEQLDRLPGVGPSTAAAIIARRDEIGRFVAEEDLLAVPGIGPSKVAAWRGLIAF
jgi:competence protein ComEA